jgi:redox-sensitive bicupin YhaK (pirin superfamily)
MSTTRRIAKILKGKPTIEGAGVHLKRAFGYSQLPQFDPFLMMDDFHTSNPSEYLPGFPWHPHRGIETVTYLLAGEVEHGDSMGNRGIIRAGEVQWMTAGSGIIHQEMPKESPSGLMWGFQLWVNLPAAHKMMPPRYRDVKAKEIPEVALQNGARAKIISGSVDRVQGPVRDIVMSPAFMDVSIPPGTTHRQSAIEGHTVFAYVLEGSAYFEEPNGAKSAGISIVGDNDRIQPRICGSESVILFERTGAEILITTAEQSVRFLFLSGQPLGEPIAWYGPIVMNTQEELQKAFEEYQNGTFIKQP